jgi:hypothetical protein
MRGRLCLTTVANDLNRGRGAVMVLDQVGDHRQRLVGATQISAHGPH